jgi:hypothetical protein
VASLHRAHGVPRGTTPRRAPGTPVWIVRSKVASRGPGNQALSGVAYYPGFDNADALQDELCTFFERWVQSMLKMGLVVWKGGSVAGRSCDVALPTADG